NEGVTAPQHWFDGQLGFRQAVGFQNPQIDAPINRLGFREQIFPVDAPVNKEISRVARDGDQDRRAITAGQLGEIQPSAVFFLLTSIDNRSISNAESGCVACSSSAACGVVVAHGDLRAYKLAKKD